MCTTAGNHCGNARQTARIYAEGTNVSVWSVFRDSGPAARFRDDAFEVAVALKPKQFRPRAAASYHIGAARLLRHGVRWLRPQRSRP
jgi:hypothetical protein